MTFKEKLLFKFSNFTRSKKAFKLDPFLRFIYNPDKKRVKPIELVLNLKDYFININTSSYLEWYMFFYGCYEPMIQTIIKQTVKPGSICIDIGANVGIHTMSLAKQTGPTGKVYAFEPHPVIFSKLINNLSLNNFCWVEPTNYAVSNKKGSGKLQSDEKSSNQGMAYLNENAKIINSTSFDVQLTSLDAFVEEKKIAHIDFLKIDVEGHETAVFQGAQNTIKAHKPFIIFENNKDHPKETQNLITDLSSLSYQFYDIRFNYLKKHDPLDDINVLTGSNILAVNTSFLKESK